MWFKMSFFASEMWLDLRSTKVFVAISAKVLLSDHLMEIRLSKQQWVMTEGVGDHFWAGMSLEGIVNSLIIWAPGENDCLYSVSVWSSPAENLSWIIYSPFSCLDSSCLPCFTFIYLSKVQIFMFRCEPYEFDFYYRQKIKWLFSLAHKW